MTKKQGDEHRPTLPLLTQAASRPRGAALATSAAAVFAVALSGCATQTPVERPRDQSTATAIVHSDQEQYGGPARPCTVNICGGQRDCK